MRVLNFTFERGHIEKLIPFITESVLFDESKFTIKLDEFNGKVSVKGITGVESISSGDILSVKDIVEDLVLEFNGVKVVVGKSILVKEEKEAEEVYVEPNVECKSLMSISSLNGLVLNGGRLGG